MRKLLSGSKVKISRALFPTWLYIRLRFCGSGRGGGLSLFFFLFCCDLPVMARPKFLSFFATFCCRRQPPSAVEVSAFLFVTSRSSFLFGCLCTDRPTASLISFAAHDSPFPAVDPPKGRASGFSAARRRLRETTSRKDSVSCSTAGPHMVSRSWRDPVTARIRFTPSMPDLLLMIRY